MTHTEKRARRQRIIEAAKAGRPIAELAAEAGLTEHYVYSMCVMAGIACNPKTLRNDKILAAAKAGKTRDELAAEFNLPGYSIYFICKRAGIQLPKRNRGRRVGSVNGPRVEGGLNGYSLCENSLKKYLPLDWDQQDHRLAKQIGVSRERIRQVRLALGKPPSKYKYWAKSSYWKEGELAKLGKHPDRDVAAMLGRPHSSIVGKRNKLGIPCIPVDRHFPWKPEDLALMGQMPDRAMAERVGVHLQHARRKRVAMGIPSWRFGVNGGNPFSKPPKPPHVWKAYEIAKLGKISDNQICREYGVPLTNIARKRRELGIPPAFPCLNPKYQARRQHEAGTSVPT